MTKVAKNSQIPGADVVPSSPASRFQVHFVDLKILQVSKFFIAGLPARSEFALGDLCGQEPRRGWLHSLEDGE